MAEKSADRKLPPDGGVKKGGAVGKTNADMKKLGRNMAKVAAQKRGR